MAATWYFSAPGRTELGGNHTDHQHGCVLAAAVNMETTAEVTRSGENRIRVWSEGYPPVEVDLRDVSVRPGERNTTAALVRGMAAAFQREGVVLGGFDARVRSNVLPGSGLSSSAAFEVLLGVICNTLFCRGRFSPVELAQMGQYAENVYFGKPCGLMDQTASSVGGMVFMDFQNPQKPLVRQIPFDFAATGYSLCLIDTGADHADLTGEYAAITEDLRTVCAFFGETALRAVPEAAFYAELKDLRATAGDRAVLRAIHVFDENRRVLRQKRALEQGDFQAFLACVTESGCSSWRYLQNITPAGRTDRQEVAFALALAEKLLRGRGACRVHGGGFAGTIQAFVPHDLLEEFQQGIARVLGCGKCHVLQIRPEGGICVGMRENVQESAQHKY